MAMAILEGVVTHYYKGPSISGVALLSSLEKYIHNIQFAEVAPKLQAVHPALLRYAAGKNNRFDQGILESTSAVADEADTYQLYFSFTCHTAVVESNILLDNLR